MVRFQKLTLTPEKFVFLWAQIKKLGYALLNDEINGPDELWKALSAPNAVHFECVEEGHIVGFACLADITKWSGVAHLTFFDRRLRGREQAVSILVKTMFEEFELEIMYAYLPVTHRASIMWLQRMGWTYDGLLKRCIKRKGQFVDMSISSITREEAFHGSIRRQSSRAKAKASTIALTGINGDSVVDGKLPTQPDDAGSANVLRRLRRWWWTGKALPSNAH